MAQPSPIIRLDDVSFSYGASATPALDHVSLGIAPGEIVGAV